MTKALLIVFVKNPVPGKVKTRIAAELGPEEACRIYTELLDHTRNQVEKLSVDIRVSYDDRIASDDLWQKFEKTTQSGGDLGQRMANDMEKAFFDGYESVVLIGSDSFEVSTKILNQGIEKLRSEDVVIGPATDGGYYLIGFQKRSFSKIYFQGIAWSTSSVLAKTLVVLNGDSLKVYQLPVLSDVDRVDDLPEKYRELGEDHLV